MYLYDNFNVLRDMSYSTADVYAWPIHTYIHMTCCECLCICTEIEVDELKYIYYVSVSTAMYSRTYISVHYKGILYQCAFSNTFSSESVVTSNVENITYPVS